MNDILNDMECFAKEQNIPIMLKDGINFLTDFIGKHNIKEVLEIGTAIGYSAIKMALVGANVTSIERDEERYKLAIENVNKCNLNDKIKLIYSDAFDVDIKDKFDLIFVDASKGKNIEFIEKFKLNLNKSGYIIVDNIDFHGLVGKSDEIKSRNLRSLVRKIEKFLDYLANQNEFYVEKIQVGDGLVILRSKNE